MLAVVVLLQIVILIAIIIVAIEGRKIVACITTLLSEIIQNQAPYSVKSMLPDPNIHEVLSKHEGHWIHHGWVRHDTPAYKRAFNTPGFALRPSMGEVVEGVQW